MSLNLASDAVFTAVSCNQVCSDGHEVTNLISTEKFKRSQGFQGERFVRTPVTIQIDLHLPCDIYRIDMTPWIGGQCAQVVEVHFYCTSPFAYHNKGASKSTSSTSDERNFKRVGTASLTHKARISFLNRGYRPHPRLQMPDKLQDSHIVNMHGNLNNVISIKIKICRMLQGSVPSISALDLWGRPARICKLETANRIISLYRERNRPCQHEKDFSVTEPAESACQTSPYEYDESVGQKRGFDENTLPQEFVDPLTCEVMHTPVLLPSGHTVDRSTLDKHICSQAEMGNVPCDPFTGIPFTDSSKPQPNVQLKLRIDKYTLDRLKISDKNSNFYNERNNHETLNPEHGGYFATKRKLEEEKATDSGKKRNMSAGRGHEAVLNSSLNEALHKTFQDQRTRRTVTLNEGTSSLYCSKCAKFLSSGATRYRLRCCHILCSECVRGGPSRMCPVCSTPFELKDIERVHT